MLNEDFDSMSAQPDATSDEEKVLRQLETVLDFTPEEVRLNARGQLSERQRRKYVRRGVTVSVVILVLSTLIVLDYLYLLFLYPSERLSESFQTLLTWGAVIFGGLYATTVIASVGLLQQHLNPRPQSTTGQLDTSSGRRMLKIGDKLFILDAEQAWQLGRLKLSGRYTLYYFKSLLGTKLLSLERQDNKG